MTNDALPFDESLHAVSSLRFPWQASSLAQVGINGALPFDERFHAVSYLWFAWQASRPEEVRSA